MGRTKSPFALRAILREEADVLASLRISIAELRDEFVGDL